MEKKIRELEERIEKLEGCCNIKHRMRQREDD